MMISRNWKCLNRKCGNEFHSYNAHPHCPRCLCVRATWVPGAVNIAKQAPAVDAQVKKLADDYGFSNLNSPSWSRLNRAAPRIQQPATDPGNLMHFGPGFSAEIARNGGATCQVSKSPIRLTGSIDVASARPMPKSQTVPGPMANARVHARHAGKVVNSA